MPSELPPVNEPVIGQVYDPRDGSSVGPAQLSIANDEILLEFTFMNSTDTPAEKLGRAGEG